MDIYLIPNEELGDFDPASFEAVAAQAINPAAGYFVLGAFREDDSRLSALVFVRVLLEGSAQLASGQKFVVLLRFRGFGEAVMLDVVSLDESLHRQIAKRYLQMSGVGVATGEAGGMWEVPYLIAGGMAQREEEIAQFDGASGDFGNLFLGVDVNALAQYLLRFAGIPAATDRIAEGRELLSGILAFMADNQGPQFYERLIDFVRERGSRLYAQNISGLIRMKVGDRMDAGESDYHRILIEEVSGGGLARHILTSAVAYEIL